MIDPSTDTSAPQFQTPMMMQYLDLKKKYPECILFFRLGDFYEMFLDDAVLGAKILGITLTRRSRGKDGAIPMCGVPYHAVDMYIPKLVQAGHKVAIAEQITSPKDTPHLVVREVVRIVTAGTMIEGRSINEKESAYVCAIHSVKKELYLALSDLATGEFYVQKTLWDDVGNVLARYQPKEIIISPKQYATPSFLGQLASVTQINIAQFADWENWQDQAENVLQQHLKVSSLRGFGITTDSEAQIAGVLFGYLSYTQHGQVAHLKNISVLEDGNSVKLDTTTIESLELFTSSMDKSSEGSLLHALDQTQTAMGARTLRRWLAQPLCGQKEIEQRLTDVEYWTKHQSELDQVRKILQKITDVERQLSKLAVGIGTARDLVALRENLHLVGQLYTFPALEQMSQSFQTFAEIEGPVFHYLKKWIQDDPPGVTKIGGMIKEGNHTELDRLRAIHTKAHAWLGDFEKKERERTGIQILKVGYNSVFGYFIEISKAQSHLVKESFGYDRKQTLVNAERYITSELKIREHEVLTAKEASDSLEFELFTGVVQHILTFSSQIQQLCHSIAYLDCITTFAHISLERNYVKPQITQEKVLSIKNGRHPVVEAFLKDQFVPNHTQMDEATRCFLITGPNMAGKSTYIRQVALITLLAHIGCFVPADSAIIPVCDRIFSRIGASDALHKGLSTFMVEMSESARILRTMTPRSLVIFDEIGRGTGIHDGLAIAQAIAEYVATMPEHPFVFFATHYHQLADLHKTFTSIKNYSMAVKIHHGKMIFLRTLHQGSTNESYGVEVAREAGLPTSVIQRAELLRSQYTPTILTSKKSAPQKKKSSLSSTEVTIKNTQLNTLTPQQALNLLYELQDKID